MVRNKRVFAEGSHEFFQGGEVSTAGWKHEAGMQQFSVELLGLFQVVGGARQPFVDG